MGRKLTPHLTLETMGSCLICLKRQTSPQISPVSKELPKALTFSSSSIHFLCQLLKIDMGNVIAQSKSTTPCILKQRKFSISKVKGLLCDKCAPLIKKLEILHRQLEKLEMNIESHLSLIHAKLLEAEEECDKQSEGLQDELETLKAIRNEMVNKCSLKFRRSRPRVKLHRLSPEKVYEKLRRSFSPIVSNVPGLQADTALLPNIIKTEGPVMSDLELGDDNENRIDDEYDDTYPAEHDNEEEVGVPFSNSDLELKVFPDPTNQVENTKVHAVANRREATNFINKSEQKCTICLRKFYDKSGLTRHFKAIHQKVRDHSCPTCGKKFRAKFELTEHQRVVHQGLTPKCSQCHKVFANKWSLNLHQKTVSCTITITPRKPRDYSKKYKFSCHVCNDKFKSPSDLKRHFNSVHLKLRKYDCHMCELKFSRADHLYKHQLQKHSIAHNKSKNRRKTSSTTELVLGP